eukprot:TRINITY_DN10717_c0_g1_i1.p1 TRINITY_DN10717_c0_g1~~TRINITY_DN10717_c0_g1_i1.p1  ORF type:complete len:151 (+),score=32.56 TRINITY_DN10717_c0_g1_i1:100-552(+)
MANRGSLTDLKITMKKHPNSLKLEEPLMSKLKTYRDDPNASGEFIIYEDSVRKLCPLAPNNVNTMACASLAAVNLGFDRVKAVLVADKSLEAHVIDIEAYGPGQGQDKFYVKTTRYNPAKPGAVTGNATYESFVSSLFNAFGRGNGVHFC